MTIGLVVAAIGLAAGALCAPTLRKQYHLHRLNHADPSVRLDAMNTLAALAVRDPSVAEPLVDALLAESAQADSANRELIDAVAVWAVERSSVVRARVGQLLPVTDGASYLRLGRWLREAGEWSRDELSVGELVRWDRTRLASPHAATRVQALESLQAIGPDAGPFLDGVLPPLLKDRDEGVRTAAIATAAVCLDTVQDVEAVAVPALHDASSLVRREAVLDLALLGSCFVFRMLDGDGLDPQEQLLASAVFSRRGTPDAYRCALPFSSNSDPHLRRLAVWALGYGVGAKASDGRESHEALLSLLGDADPTVAARAAAALARWHCGPGAQSSLIAYCDWARPEARPAALLALGRCHRSPQDRQAAIEFLRGTLLQALRSGHSPIAAAAVESLGLLNDADYLRVMLDIVDEFEDQPMLQYAAAVAAVQIDQTAGFDALLNLCNSVHDETRELAALRISMLAEPPVEKLFDALQQGGDPQRGGAALALALCGRFELGPKQSLDDWLSDRLDNRSADFERSWQIRTNYLCARLLCGTTSMRQELDVYLLNRNVSRMGLFITLLHMGETLPLDALLLDNCGVDAQSFLFDARFIDVVSRYVPEALGWSGPFWQADAEVLATETDLLRHWWRIHRQRLRFVSSARQWRYPLSERDREFLSHGYRTD